MVHQLLFFNYKTQKHTATPNEETGDLALSTGDFLITDTGVMCRLREPLTKLSGHYSWGRIPFGIATLKLLVVAPDTDAFEVVMRMFSRSEQEMLADGLGTIMSFDESVAEQDESAFLAQDIEQLLSWAPRLASRCPFPDVANELKMLPTMQPDDLGDFVGKHLGLG